MKASKTKEYLNELEKHLEFTIKGTTFKQVGIKRDLKGNFDLILIKNLDKGSFKYVQRQTLENIINL
jgi:hypothetical protein